MRSREAYETSDKAERDEWSIKDVDAEGYYPGEKQYRLDHSIPLDPIYPHIVNDTATIVLDRIPF